MSKIISVLFLAGVVFSQQYETSSVDVYKNFVGSYGERKSLSYGLNDTLRLITNIDSCKFGIVRTYEENYWGSADTNWYDLNTNTHYNYPFCGTLDPKNIVYDRLHNKLYFTYSLMDEPGADSSYVYLTHMQISPYQNGNVNNMESYLINVQDDAQYRYPVKLDLNDDGQLVIVQGMKENENFYYGFGVSMLDTGTYYGTENFYEQNYSPSQQPTWVIKNVIYPNGVPNNNGGNDTLLFNLIYSDGQYEIFQDTWINNDNYSGPLTTTGPLQEEPVSIQYSAYHDAHLRISYDRPPMGDRLIVNMWDSIYVPIDGLPGEFTLNYGIDNSLWTYDEYGDERLLITRDSEKLPVCRINDDGTFLIASMIEFEGDTLISSQKRDQNGNLLWEDEFLLSDYDPEGEIDYYRWNRLSDIMQDSEGRIIVSGELVKKWGSNNHNYGIMMVFETSVSLSGPQVWYVNNQESNGESFSQNGMIDNPFYSIHQAINASSNGDTIIVYPGAYEGGGGSLEFDEKVVSLKSLYQTYQDTFYINNTIIYGQPYGSVIHYNNINMQNEDYEYAVLDGFTIKGGEVFDRGGGVSVDNSWVIIRNCRIKDNSVGSMDSDVGGGGVSASNLSKLQIWDSWIYNNYSRFGGGVAVFQSEFYMYNSKIIGNTSSQGGGIYTEDPFDIYIVGCLIDGNFAEENGGGVYTETQEGDTLYINRSTLVNNYTAPTEQPAGSAIYIDGNVNLSNSIVWDNPTELTDFVGEIVDTDNSSSIVFEGNARVMELILDYINLDGGTEGVYFSGTNTQVTIGDSVFNENPLFCDSTYLALNPSSDVFGNSYVSYDTLRVYPLAANSSCLNDNFPHGYIGAFDVGCDNIFLGPQVSFDANQFQEIGPGDYGFLMVEDITDTLPIFVTSSGASEMIISAYTDTLDLIANVLEENGSYEIELVPTANWNGYADLLVTVNDEAGQDTAEVLVFVEPVDDPPVIVDIPDQETEEDTPLRVELEVYDVDGDYVDVHIREDMLYNTDGYIIANGDSILLVPHPNWHGTETVQVVAHSGIQEVFSSFTLTVNPVDDDPFIDGYLPDVYLYEDFEDTLREDLRGIFEDVDGELTFSVAFETEGVVSGAVVGDTMLTLTSLQDANGVSEMYVTASNPTRASVTDTVLITVFEVNDPPVINDIEPITMEEDTPYEFMSMASLYEAGTLVDVDNTLEELSFYLEPDNEHLSVEWDGDASTLPTIHPEQDYNGPGSLNLCVWDEYEERCLTIGVNVNPVNDAPYFSSEMYAPVGVELEFHLPLNPMDVDSEDLVATLTQSENNPAWVMVTDHILHGTPDMLGEYSVFLTLTDGQATIVDTFNLNVVNFKPEIVAIEDIPNDQGGRVYVGFTPSFLDNGEHSGQGYDVYRHDMVDGESGWVMVASGNAIGEEHYVFEATTLSDSSSGYDWATEFKVVAAMENGIFHSDPVVGYSVDNIAPGIPGGLMAVAMDDNIHLSWNMSTDEDFQYFVLEKATNMDFTEPEVIQTADTAYTDVNFTVNETNYYRLVALDHAGNTSDYSEVVEASVLSIDENMVPAVFALHQNYPNPFNPTTQIKYDIAEDSFVSITIFDVMGRNIRTLMNVSQTAGYHSIHWDAKNDMGEGVSAGMYIYVIQAGEFRATKKMVLLK